MLNSCVHSDVYCLNPYELIRKYLCLSCFEVMMCSCDEEFGRKYLPHQLSFATELSTKTEIRVSLGFQPRICRECRGLQPESNPVAAIHSRTSKLRRYYWREIAFETIKRFAEWSGNLGYSDWTQVILKHQ